MRCEFAIFRWNWDDSGDRPYGWRARVNRAQTEEELAAVRRSVERGRLLGEAAWAKRIAAELGLESTLRPRGRPPKKKEAEGGSERPVPFISLFA